MSSTTPSPSRTRSMKRWSTTAEHRRLATYDGDVGENLTLLRDRQDVLAHRLEGWAGASPPALTAGLPRRSSVPDLHDPDAGAARGCGCDGRPCGFLRGSSLGLPEEKRDLSSTGSMRAGFEVHRPQGPTSHDGRVRQLRFDDDRARSGHHMVEAAGGGDPAECLLSPAR